ncbi:hypothetical protein [Lentilitoribacter sp. EG35]|uniref:hypothetical protein n=1 Tax=Lentilitoribacter sp. EG35 TaxID=3234192 RepID=UPI00346058AE
MYCYGREVEIKEIWNRIKIDENLLMLAPRRIGKTVILNELQEQAESNNFHAVIVDVEGYHEEKDFFRQCCASIQEELSFGSQLMSSLVGKINAFVTGKEEIGDWRQLLLQTNWDEFADHLFSHMVAQDDQKNWLILVDELPVFLQTMAQKGKTENLSAFLYSLRRFRQRYPTVRWVFAGSIGLDTVAREFNIEGALNDLHPLSVNQFTQETADGFLSFICEKRGLSITQKAKNAIFERLGWLSPFYLERIIEDAILLSQEEVGVKEVDDAMNNLISLTKRLYWAHWREHLDRNFSEPTRGRLYKMLNTVAKVESITEEGLFSTCYVEDQNLTRLEFREHLDTLMNDGYLIQNAGKIQFSMRLLNEWWKRFVSV